MYRLGCSSAPLEAVVDKIMGAVAHLFRAEDTKVVRDIYCELQDASQLLGTRLLTGSVSEQAFDQLSFAVGVLKEDAAYSELARFAERAALRTFNEMDQSGEHWDDERSETTLHAKFSFFWDLGERRCFSVTREGIMESAQRDHRAQLAWESKVRDTILGPSATISKSLLADEGNVMVRAPKRLFQPKPVTMVTWTAPLQVLQTPR